MFYFFPVSAAPFLGSPQRTNLRKDLATGLLVVQRFVQHCKRSRQDCYEYKLLYVKFLPDVAEETVKCLLHEYQRRGTN